MRTTNSLEKKMKNKLTGKKIGTVISIFAALAVAILFWLIVKYIDSGALVGDGVTAFVSDITGGALL